MEGSKRKSLWGHSSSVDIGKGLLLQLVMYLLISNNIEGVGKNTRKGTYRYSRVVYSPIHSDTSNPQLRRLSGKLNDIV